MRPTKSLFFSAFPAVVITFWMAVWPSRLPDAPAFIQTQGSEVAITSPVEGETLRGVVAITGTTADPQFNFYELEFAADPPSEANPWTALQPPVAQQVRDGILGVWDTTTVADGRYHIRLRVTRLDNSVVEVSVGVVVVNATATPLPTPLPTFTATPPPGTPTPGPSPTPLIIQPPTRTPRPTATPGGPTATPQPFDPEASPFQPARLRRAAWTGVWLTIMVFTALGGYAGWRAYRRGELRNWRKQLNTELIEPLRALISRLSGKR